MTESKDERRKIDAVLRPIVDATIKTDHPHPYHDFADLMAVARAVYSLTHPEAQGNKDSGEPPLTRLEVRDEIAAIMVQWQMDGPSYPLEGARKFLVECREGKHIGDCTKSPWTCLRCQCDDAYLQADAVLVALQASAKHEAAPINETDEELPGSLMK